MKQLFEDYCHLSLPDFRYLAHHHPKQVVLAVHVDIFIKNRNSKRRNMDYPKFSSSNILVGFFYNRQGYVFLRLWLLPVKI